MIPTCCVRSWGIASDVGYWLVLEGDFGELIASWFLVHTLPDKFGR